MLGKSIALVHSFGQHCSVRILKLIHLEQLPGYLYSTMNINYILNVNVTFHGKRNMLTIFGQLNDDERQYLYYSKDVLSISSIHPLEVFSPEPTIFLCI